MTERKQKAKEDEGTPPPVVRIGRLNTPGANRRELVRLYADLRNGRVDPKVANAGAFVLAQVLKSIELEMTDKRLVALEERAESIARGPSSKQEGAYARH